MNLRSYAVLLFITAYTITKAQLQHVSNFKASHDVSHRGNSQDTVPVKGITSSLVPPEAEGLHGRDAQTSQDSDECLEPCPGEQKVEVQTRLLSLGPGQHQRVVPPEAAVEPDTRTLQSDHCEESPDSEVPRLKVLEALKETPAREEDGEELRPEEHSFQSSAATGGEDVGPDLLPQRSELLEDRVEDQSVDEPGSPHEQTRSQSRGPAQTAPRSQQEEDEPGSHGSSCCRTCFREGE